MREATLGDVAAWGSGGTPKRSVPEYFGDGIPWLSISDLNDGVVCNAKESLTHLGVENSSAKIVPKGSILVAMYGSIGKLGVAGRELCTSQAIAFAKPNTEVTHPRYLFHFLLAQRPKLQARGRGGTQMNIGQGDLKAWKIPLPPLGEQRRIAAILDQADAILAKRRVVVDQVDALARSIFLDMFGDPDSAAKVISFGKVAKLEGGRNVVASDPNVASKHRVIKISAVTSGIFRPQESKPLPANYDPPSNHFVRQGDLLMSRANTTELVGAVAYVQQTPKNLVLPDKVWKFQWLCKGSVPEFYYALFRSRSIRNKISRLSSGTSGSMKNVSKAKLSSMLIPDISLAEQEEFARRSKSVSAQRAVAQRALDRDNELFASLQSRAFRGEL